MRIFTILLAICAMDLAGQARPQDTTTIIFGASTDYLTFAPVSATTIDPFNSSVEPLVESPTAPQCLYDYTGFRVSQGCPAQLPPQCDKGVLVQTSVGEEYELCCCNFSNRVDNNSIQ